MRQRSLDLLGGRRTYLVLIALNILIGGANVAHSVALGYIGNDHHSYMALAEGLRHGHYSQYWYLPQAFPDTFRAPGFPLYVAAVTALFGSWRVVVVIHLLLFVLGVHLTFKVMERFGHGLPARNLFLVLLLSSQNIVVFIPLVNSEIPAIACIALTIFLDPVYRRPRPWTGVALGLISGFLFQCRPVFLLLPFARMALDLVYNRKHAHKGTLITYAFTYTLTLLPFAFWNLNHHGVFRATPLEGGGGVFHMGYWAGRMPGYQQNRYWGNFAADEVVRFVPADSLQANINAYEREWDEIDSTLAPLLTADDSVMLSHFKAHVNEKTFNTRYTLAREAILKERTIEHALEHPGYFIAYKLYTAVRLWVIGIDRGRFLQADAQHRLTMAAPTLVTLVQFLLALLVIPLAHIRGYLRLRDTYPILLVILYGWLTSIPFTIQSRYTVPMRFLFFALTAMALVAWLRSPRRTGDDEAQARP